jgi:HSP20 family protein
MTTNLMPMNLATLLDTFFTPPASCAGVGAGDGLWTAPRTEVFEGDKDYIIRMDLPGVNRQDLEIEIENDTLTVKGRREPKSEEGYRPVRREQIGTISYRRSFDLVRQIDPESIQAQMQDGVLSITLAKHAQAMPRRIEVK